MERTVISTLAWIFAALAAGGVEAFASEVILHSFACPPGVAPESGLIRDSAGNLFGTTSAGGAYGGGTFFTLNTSGTATVLHSFGGGTDGSSPFGTLVRDAAGNFYGVAGSGGVNGYGIVYALDTRGHETVLYSFSGKADGGYPTGSGPRRGGQLVWHCRQRWYRGLGHCL